MLAFLHTGELGLLLALALALVALLATFFPRLTAPVSPCGIVSLELAETPVRAERILQAWRAAGWLGQAKRSIYVDFVFIVVYAGALAALALLSGRAAEASGLMGSGTAEWYGGVLAVSMFVARALDVVENFALLKVLARPEPDEADREAARRGEPPRKPSRLWTLVAAACAATKFALLYLGAATAIFVLVIALDESI